MRYREPDEIVFHVSEALARQNPQDMFVTLFCAVFELGKDRVVCASAGHPSLVLTRPGAPPLLPVAPTGGVAGFMMGQKFTRTAIDVKPGDTVVLYTDGVTEAMDAQDRLFGEERLVAQLAAQPGGTAAEAVAGVVGAVRASSENARRPTTSRSSRSAGARDRNGPGVTSGVSCSSGIESEDSCPSHASPLALVLLVAPALGGSSPLQAVKLDTAKIEEITKLGRLNEQEGSCHGAAHRREGRRRRLDDAAVHGPTSWAAFQAEDGAGNGDRDPVLFQDGELGDERAPRRRRERDRAAQPLLRRAEGLLHAPRRRGQGRGAAGVQGFDKVAESAPPRRNRRDARAAAAGGEFDRRHGDRERPRRQGPGQGRLYKVVGTAGATGCARGPRSPERGARRRRRDFCLRRRAQPVLKALRRANVEVVAIHSHMEGETPKAIFLHYWGVGPVEELARAVKAALDTQKK
jgi:hypothetical protein